MHLVQNNTESHGWSVKTVELGGARRLVSIETDSEVWSSDVDVRQALGSKYKIEGAIVRVKPPAVASDEQITHVKELLAEHGAVAVKVLPRASGEIPAHVAKESRGRGPQRTIRQVVLDRAAAVSNSRDRDALLQTLNNIMDEAGL